MREEEEGRQQRGRREQQRHQNTSRVQREKNRPTPYSKVNFCLLNKATGPEYENKLNRRVRL